MTTRHPLYATRVVVAPDKFKGGADAATVAAAIVAGLRDVWGDAPGIVVIPMANGGDGTVEAFLTTGAAARIDDQTLRGEVVAGVAKLARPLGIPVIALGGSIDVAAEYELAALGVTCRPIADGPRTLDEAMRCAPELVRAAAARFARMALLARG